MNYCNIFQLIFLIILNSKRIPSLNISCCKIANASNFSSETNKKNDLEEVNFSNGTLNYLLYNKTNGTKIGNNQERIVLVKKGHLVSGHDFIKIDNNDFEKKIIKRAIQYGKKFKWGFPIKYKISHNILRRGVLTALSFIMRETCIKFKEVNGLVGNGLIYQFSTICASTVGKNPINTPQIIYLSPSCMNSPSIQHETLHALGLEHEMSRKDRDNYIQINKHFIDPRDYTNFRIEKYTKTYNLRYDYGSLMHYDRYSSGKGDMLTIVPKNHHYLKTIGQKSGASFNDVKLLNLHYCNNSCSKKLKCLNFGYTNPNNCNICKCPTMFSGTFCQKIAKSNSNCPKQTLYTEGIEKQLIVQGRKNCYFQIVAPNNFRIKIYLESYNLFYQHICQPNMGLEIKFLNDKSVSGIRFCEQGGNKIITSEKQLTLIQYVGYNQQHYIKIRYVQV